MLTARSPDSSRSDRAATSWPVTRTVPAVGRSKVPIRCSSVDLPDPDGPATATSSPSATAKLIPRNATTGGWLG
jgi:hypothetical protein